MYLQRYGETLYVCVQEADVISIRSRNHTMTEMQKGTLSYMQLTSRAHSYKHSVIQSETDETRTV